MKEVLKHGWYFYKTNNEHIVQCRDCECEFKYDDNDTYTYKSIFPMIDENGKPQYPIGKYVNCPECGNCCLLYIHKKFE